MDNDNEIVYFQTINSRYSEKQNNSEKEYLLNNEKLIKSDKSDEEFSKSDFLSLIKDNILNFINKRFSQIILLAGAGASITGESEEKQLGKSMSDISVMVDNQLTGSELFSLKEISELCHYQYSSVKENEFNLEDLISKIISGEEYVNPKSKEKYSRTKNKIFDVIKEATNYDFSSELLKHDAVINILSNKLVAPQKLTVATTNYDTLFEEAAKSKSYTVMDGFTFDSEPYFDADMFEWNMVRDIPYVSTDQLEYKKQVINLIKLHGSLTWERGNDGKVYKKNKQNIKNPLMIFPSSNKYMLSYTEPYFDLFSKFQELINRPNSLLIVNGFSFGDDHISQMIHHAVTHNAGLEVLISDFNVTSQKSKGWRHMKELMDSGYPVVFLKATMANLSFFIQGVDSNEHR